MLNRCINYIQGIVYPPTCLLCGSGVETGQNLCRGCAAELPFNQHCCRICALPLESEAQICARCQKQPPAFDHSCMPFRYQSPFDYLVSDFKFRHNLAGGDLLAQLFCQQRQLPTPLPDRLIPVPLHRRRLRQRGFNQAQLLATAIGRQIGIAVDHQLVQRIRHTPAQHELSGKQRRRNLRGAFELTADCKGLSLAIVDDVVTTGSTVNELARVLKQAGANSVQAWAIARTPAK